MNASTKISSSTTCAVSTFRAEAAIKSAQPVNHGQMKSAPRRRPKPGPSKVNDNAWDGSANSFVFREARVNFLLCQIEASLKRQIHISENLPRLKHNFISETPTLFGDGYVRGDRSLWLRKGYCLDFDLVPFIGLPQ